MSSRHQQYTCYSLVHSDHNFALLHYFCNFRDFCRQILQHFAKKVSQIVVSQCFACSVFTTFALLKCDLQIWSFATFCRFQFRKVSPKEFSFRKFLGHFANVGMLMMIRLWCPATGMIVCGISLSPKVLLSMC